ncbi:pyridoxal-phosphate dependent enzyme [Sphingosinicella sp. CPCC 101087]|uniref:pyridoxal-phosphate dependent enzyme n=1 Tax=Sphingosinicella sp. CPCC 101087 TaxID=2497754 RepID=UPI0013EAED90|nr:pyridoxal-phosphate dependent enzyme [Sphingosinicella sp. CPCC 101087]
MDELNELEFAASPLLDLPRLARQAQVERVFVKDEGTRPLGNFKVLGGMLAGLRALARAGGDRSVLICASDGNHGLAVAAAAQRAGANARIYLPRHASVQRATRIEAIGGEVVWIEGSYDDAVDMAAAAAEAGEGLLVPDTTSRAYEPAVAEVMEGYGRICMELSDQLPLPPTHLFVQAGVGGLAAAMAEGLRGQMAAPGKIIVVEPENAACVAAGLATGKPVRIGGDLLSCAEMLSCGLASAPALEILLRHAVDSICVGEPALQSAVGTLLAGGGPLTSPSGAAGLAGLAMVAHSPRLRNAFELANDSRVLIVATEGAPA